MLLEAEPVYAMLVHATLVTEGDTRPPRPPPPPPTTKSNAPKPPESQARSPKRRRAMLFSILAIVLAAGGGRRHHGEPEVEDFRRRVAMCDAEISEFTECVANRGQNETACVSCLTEYVPNNVTTCDEAKAYACGAMAACPGCGRSREPEYVAIGNCKNRGICPSVRPVRFGTLLAQPTCRAAPPYYTVGDAGGNLSVTDILHPNERWGDATRLRLAIRPRGFYIRRELWERAYWL